MAHAGLLDAGQGRHAACPPDKRQAGGAHQGQHQGREAQQQRHGRRVPAHDPGDHPSSGRPHGHRGCPDQQQPAGQVAIVAPYRAQGRLIRRLHELAAGLGEAEPADIVVDTVERIQGQERDLIIVSLTTSDPDHAAGRAEFFFQPNRLNVSITRPRVKRIVIGSPHLWRAEPKDPKHRPWVEHFRALYEQSTRVRHSG